MCGAGIVDFLVVPTEFLCDPFPFAFTGDDVIAEDSVFVLYEFRLPSTTKESSLFAFI